jgi:cell division protein FtsA
MREVPPAHFFGIDVGTSKVRVVVGMLDQHDPSQIAVIGHGTSLNSGIRKGAIVHLDEAAEAISHAVSEAERVSGVQIKSATVNINGSHIKGLNSTGVIAISSSDREITVDDRYRAEEAAAILQLPPNQDIIQVFAKNYRVDGQDNIKDPVGMHGVRLEVDTHIVTVASPILKSLKTSMERANLEVSHVTVSSLAAAEAVLNRQQKEAGTLLLDIGAGTTNLVVVEDGEVQHVGVIPVGGINITNDLAIGLRTDLDVAEKVKLEHANLLGGKHKEIVVEHNDETFRFNSYDIHMVVSARVEELLELVQKELKTIGKIRKLPGGVVLVGGTSNIPGIENVARDKLELATRIGTLQSLKGLVDVIDDPSYATAIGLMQLDMLLTPESDDKVKGSPNQKVLGMIEGLVSRLRQSGRSK